MSRKKPQPSRHRGNIDNTQNGSFDIREMIKKAQCSQNNHKKEHYVEVSEVEEALTSTKEAIDIIETEWFSMPLDITHDLPEEQKEDQEPPKEIANEEKEEIPLPRRKTELEKYLKSKEREEQIRRYNEDVIKQTREERARQRAKVRQRSEEPYYENETEADEDKEDRSEVLDQSPTKRVRFCNK